MVSGRFGCALGAPPCELLGARWLREGLLGALRALPQNGSEVQSPGLLSNYQGRLVGRAVSSLPPVPGDRASSAGFTARPCVAERVGGGRGPSPAGFWLVLRLWSEPSFVSWRDCCR